MTFYSYKNCNKKYLAYPTTKEQILYNIRRSFCQNLVIPKAKELIFFQKKLKYNF